MTDEQQRKIFAKNLNYYISQSGLQQKDIAQALGFNSSTFNTWCVGKIIPGMGKVQKIADYFGIGKTDLIDDKLDSVPSFDAKVLSDMEILEMIKKYYELSPEDKKCIKHLIESLHKKAES